MRSGIFRLAMLALGLAGIAEAGPEPGVTGFTPRHGPPGTLVKIAGEHLDAVTAVEFANGIRAEFRLATNTMLKVTVPAAAASGPIRLIGVRDAVETPGPFIVIRDAPGAVELAPPAPNPSTGPASLRFTLPRAARVHLRVLDTAGRVVRILEDGPLPAGAFGRTWDGRDARGRQAGPGMYFVALDVLGERHVASLARMR